MTSGYPKSYRIAAGRVLMGLALFALIAVAFAQDKPQPSLVSFAFGLGNDAFAPAGFKLEDEATRAVNNRLKSEKTFRVQPFSRTHPSVKRALAEGSIRSMLLWPPFTGKNQGQYKAITLAKLMRSDLALAGMIESVEFDEENNIGRLVVAIELYDVKAGKLKGTVVLTAEGAGETEVEAITAAIANLAETAVPQAITILKTPAKSTEPPLGRHS